MLYDVKVPPTNEQGSYHTVVRPNGSETVAQQALADYNSARAHDGLEPLRRMPAGTTYTARRLWIVQTYTGAQYGWEDVYAGETRNDAKQRLQEYRQNQSDLQHRLTSRIDHDA